MCCICFSRNSNTFIEKSLHSGFQHSRFTSLLKYSIRSLNPVKAPNNPHGNVVKLWMGFHVCTKKRSQAFYLLDFSIGKTSPKFKLVFTSAESSLEGHSLERMVVYCTHGDSPTQHGAHPHAGSVKADADVAPLTSHSSDG